MRLDQGQGGGQAIEDAGALGIFLANVQRIADIPRRLELVQNIRRKRAGAMQIFSNAGQDQAARIEEDAKQYVDGPVPSKSCALRFKPTDVADMCLSSESCGVP